MGNSTPGATTKFKIWGQRWYVLRVDGEAPHKSKLLFSIAEEHPKWLCWYSFDEVVPEGPSGDTFNVDAMKRSTGVYDDGPGGDRGLILRKANAETLGNHSLINYHITVPEPMTVLDFGKPIGRPDAPGGNFAWIDAMKYTPGLDGETDGVKAALTIKLDSGTVHTFLSMVHPSLGDIPTDRKVLKGIVWPLLVEPFSLHHLHSTKRFVPKLLER